MCRHKQHFQNFYSLVTIWVCVRFISGYPCLCINDGFWWRGKKLLSDNLELLTDGVGRWGTSDSWGWWAIHCQLLIYFSEPFHVAARKLICQEPGRLPALGKISATSWLEQTYSAGCIDRWVQNFYRKSRYKTVSKEEINTFSFLFYASFSCGKVEKFSLLLIQRREIYRYGGVPSHIPILSAS